MLFVFFMDVFSLPDMVLISLYLFLLLRTQGSDGSEGGQGAPGDRGPPVSHCI